MRRIVVILFAFVLSLFPVFSLGESQAIIIPDVIFDSLYPEHVLDLEAVENSYLSTISGEIWSDWEGDDFVSFWLDNAKISQHIVEHLECYISEKPNRTSSVDIEILQPFGESLEKSQTYIDTVNYYQSKYGRAFRLNEENLIALGIYPSDHNWLIWEDGERNITIGICYIEGDVFDGISPTIKLAIRTSTEDNN